MGKSKSNNLVRIVLVVILLAFVALKLFDLSARSRAKDVYTAVIEMMNAGETAQDGTISQAQIHDRFGPPTDGYSSGDKLWTDAYRFRGALRSHAALVEYTDRVEKLVIGASTE